MVRFENIFAAALRARIDEDTLNKVLKKDVWYEAEVFDIKFLVMVKKRSIFSRFKPKFMDIICVKKLDNEIYKELPHYMVKSVESFTKNFNRKHSLSDSWIHDYYQSCLYEPLDLSQLFVEL